tara:strand:- start:3211 stop:4677 length:1467 start_codon:yes stop_codon:yes gene_type:complete
MHSNEILDIKYQEVKVLRETRRIWLEGDELNRAGFKKGDLYTTVFDFSKRTLKLKRVVNSDENQAKAKARTGEVKVVSGRQMKGWIKPIIDVCNADVTELLQDVMKLRAIIKQGEILVTIHHEEINRLNRESSLKENVKAGFVTEASSFSGFGISTDGISEGIKLSGLESRVEYLMDKESRYLDVARINNKEKFGNAKFITGSIEEIEPTLIDPVNIYSFSMPCTNYSSHGKSKKKLDSAEDSSEATALFGTINMIRAFNPAVIVSENVPNAKGSASYKMLISELERMGYNVFETTLDRTHGKCLEDRKRYWFIAVSKGMSDIDFNDFMVPEQVYATVADALEDIPTDSVRFSPLDKLEARDKKNKEAGRNFSLNLVSPSDKSVSTIVRLYHKHQVSNPHLSLDGKNYRLFTKLEHARMKEIPERFVADISDTLAHEGCGQSVSYKHALGCGVLIGKAICEFANFKDVPTMNVETGQNFVLNFGEKAA